MNKLKFHFDESIVNLINIDDIKKYLNPDTILHIYGLGKNKRGYGHFNVYIDCKLNDDWVLMETITTDTLNIDKAWSNNYEPIETAQAYESLIIQILKANQHKF